jgi:hypothetical protein
MSASRRALDFLEGLHELLKLNARHYFQDSRCWLQPRAILLSEKVACLRFQSFGDVLQATDGNIACAALVVLDLLITNGELASEGSLTEAKF